MCRTPCQNTKIVGLVPGWGPWSGLRNTTMSYQIYSYPSLPLRPLFSLYSLDILNLYPGHGKLSVPHSSFYEIIYPSVYVRTHAHASGLMYVISLLLSSFSTQRHLNTWALWVPWHSPCSTGLQAWFAQKARNMPFKVAISLVSFCNLSLVYTSDTGVGEETTKDTPPFFPESDCSVISMEDYKVGLG